MNIWTILGIEPTCDIAAIKSAYAAMAKVHHPEEQPEEFQKLQKAYKEAVRYAKTHAGSNVHAEINTYAGNNVYAESNTYAGNNVQKDKRQGETAGEPSGWEEQPAAGKEQSVSGEENAQEEITEEEPLLFAPWDEYFKNEPQEELQSSETEEENFQEKSSGHEHAREQANETSARIDTEDILDQSDFYDYEGIGAEYADTRFWNELAVFIYHPYLRNNIDCWRYFLEQPDYEELFKDNNFRKTFVEHISDERIKERYVNWHKDTVLFLDKYLKGYGKDAPIVHETSLPCWKKLLRHASKEKSLLTHPCDTEEEWNVYRILWGRDTGKKDGALKDKEEIRKYLMSFFAYAAENRLRLWQIYQESTRVRRKRRRRHQKIKIFCVCAISVLLFIRVMEMATPAYERKMKDLKKEYNKIYSEIYDEEENKKVDEMAKEAIREYEQLMISK